MNDFCFRLINALNCDGLDNGSWGLVKDVRDTERYFGTKVSESLSGQWLYIYASEEEFDGIGYGIPEPTKVMPLKDGDNVYLYDLN